MNDTVSDPIESLRLVSDEDFSFVHYAMQKRIPHQGQLQKNEKGEYSNTKLPLSEHSARQLTGLLYCANCGSRMVGTYSSRIYGGERHYRKVYRCYTGTIKSRKDENEMGVYNADRIEKAVLAVVHQYFMEFTDNPEDIWREQSRRMLKNQFSDNIRDLEAKLTKLRKQETNLRQEVVRAISGESDFDTGMLRSLLDENAAAIAETEAKLSDVKEQQGNEEEKLSVMTKHCRNICIWAEEFDKADVETQKMILARIIEKITVDKHYNIHIKFFITREEFLGMQDSITVSEASAFMTA
ncbi:MAG: hypothetical protein CW338_03530 [Clostridiales bacterium]|nr:hypothetical protein [Clostridiales bacterium]